MKNIINRYRERRGSDKGFTLIELLIVIVVLGILAAVVIFALGGVTAKSAVAACQSDGATLQTAIADANQLNAPNVVTSKQTEGTFVDSGKGIQQWPTGNGFASSDVRRKANFPDSTAWLQLARRLMQRLIITAFTRWAEASSTKRRESGRHRGTLVHQDDNDNSSRSR